MSLIKLNNVVKTFSSNGNDVHALRDLNFEIQEGDFISITGESGSGKSTLLSILGGISPPTSGVLEVDGIDVYKLPIENQADFRREFIGFVFQQFHLIPYLTAIENVMLPLSITDAKDHDAMAQSALDKVGLGEKAGRLPSELSGGEQQRVAVARALVNSPPIILADEPTGNLDSKTGEEIFKLFKELNNAGQTVILVTHNPELARKADRGIVMLDGLVHKEVVHYDPEHDDCRIIYEKGETKNS